MSKGSLSYGGSGSSSDPLGDKNFIGASFSGLSFTCTPIEIIKTDGSDEIAFTATGFFWLKDSQPYLITNWHVVSGQNIFTRFYLKDGFFAKRFKFYGMSISLDSGIVSLQRKSWLVQLEEEFMNRISSPPNINGQIIDIFAIPIPEEILFGRDAARVGFNGAADASCFLNDNIGQRIVTNVSDECFILGYPLKNYDGLMPPIWKRGSIASETLIGVEGRPIFFVDAATTKGMSGSPIIRKATTFTADNKDIGALQEFSSFDLIGIYAGRLENKELESVNLGYGWYKMMIDHAIDYYALLKPTLCVDIP